MPYFALFPCSEDILMVYDLALNTWRKDQQINNEQIIILTYDKRKRKEA